MASITAPIAALTTMINSRHGGGIGLDDPLETMFSISLSLMLVLTVVWLFTFAKFIWYKLYENTRNYKRGIIDFDYFIGYGWAILLILLSSYWVYWNVVNKPPQPKSVISKTCKEPINTYCKLVYISRTKKYCIMIKEPIYGIKYLWDNGEDIDASYEPYTQYADSCDAKQLAFDYKEQEAIKHSFK